MKGLDFALSGLGNDKFRTALSLSGIAVGIFSIVAVFTLVDSLKRSLDEGLREFGSDVVFVEQIPLEPDLNEDGTFRWWKYVERPQLSFREYEYLRDEGKCFSKITWSCYPQDGRVVGVTDGWELTIRNKLSSGRPFTLREMLDGAPVALVGADYADEHPGEKKLLLDGCTYEIIGVFERSGINSISLTEIDGAVVIPAVRARGLQHFAGCRQSITIAPSANVDEDTFLTEIRTLLRSYRHLSPDMEDNFAINRLSFIVEQVETLFSMINKICWLIGLFSILVGGFSIANILFISVKERTAQIGMQKALGARRLDILLEFLYEAVLLAVIGAAAGMIFLWLVTLCFKGSAIELSLSFGNILLGLGLAFLIGIAAGVAPATAAANMNPVDAIRSRF